MKEYKYIINGKEYTVSVGERKDGISPVTVNGETYDVALVPEPKKERKVVVKAPASTPKTGEKDDKNQKESFSRFVARNASGYCVRRVYDDK